MIRCIEALTVMWKDGKIVVVDRFVTPEEAETEKATILFTHNLAILDSNAFLAMLANLATASFEAGKKNFTS